MSSHIRHNPNKLFGTALTMPVGHILQPEDSSRYSNALRIPQGMAMHPVLHMAQAHLFSKSCLDLMLKFNQYMKTKYGET